MTSRELETDWSDYFSYCILSF